MFCKILPSCKKLIKLTFAIVLVKETAFFVNSIVIEGSNDDDIVRTIRDASEVVWLPIDATMKNGNDCVEG